MALFKIVSIFHFFFIFFGLMSMHQFNGGGLSAAILKNIPQTLIDFIKFCTMGMKLNGASTYFRFFPSKFCRWFFFFFLNSHLCLAKKFSNTPRCKSERKTIRVKLSGIIIFGLLVNGFCVIIFIHLCLNERGSFENARLTAPKVNTTITNRSLKDFLFSLVR